MVCNDEKMGDINLTINHNFNILTRGQEGEEEDIFV